jgi:hypothetical protein
VISIPDDFHEFAVKSEVNILLIVAFIGPYNQHLLFSPFLHDDTVEAGNAVQQLSLQAVLTLIVT